MNGWWSRASTVQRLTQVDAGIELGLSGRQIALASGADPGLIYKFVQYHDRSLVRTRGRRDGRNTVAAKRSAATAYFRGERVDFWRDGAQVRDHLGEGFEDVLE